MMDRARFAALVGLLLLCSAGHSQEEATTHSQEEATTPSDPGTRSKPSTKTDVVVLRNGDHVTCSLKELSSGKLRVSTDDMGTIYLDWLQVAEVTSTDTFEVETASGGRHVGSLQTEGGLLVVTSETASAPLDFEQVVELHPIAKKFWKRVDGSFDLGFSYTQAESTADLNLNAHVEYRRPAKITSLDGSVTVNAREDAPSTQRGDVTMTHLRVRRPKLFSGFLVQAQRNDELGLDLRALGGFGVGRNFKRSVRTELRGMAGLAVSEEWPQNQPSQDNLEAFLGGLYRFNDFDQPNTEISLRLIAFPSLSESSRLRLEASFSIKRELVKDLYFSISAYESYDSEPLAVDVEQNDWGVSTSLGWSW
jgi:Protein of unknown function, DUF481